MASSQLCFYRRPLVRRSKSMITKRRLRMLARPQKRRVVKLAPPKFFALPPVKLRLPTTSTCTFVWRKRVKLLHNWPDSDRCNKLWRVLNFRPQCGRWTWCGVWLATKSPLSSKSTRIALSNSSWRCVKSSNSVSQAEKSWFLQSITRGRLPSQSTSKWSKSMKRTTKTTWKKKMSESDDQVPSNLNLTLPFKLLGVIIRGR